jgi:8-oxo-dGTP diphosphatase
VKLNNCPQCGSELVGKKEGEYERAYCEECGEFVYVNPVPVVAGVIQDESERVLLVKRGIEPCINRWSLPSGFIEINETPEEGVLREIKEETNLTCAIKRLQGVYQQRGWKYESIIVISYVLEVVSGRPRAGDDAIAVDFFGYDSLPEIPFASHREIIQSIFNESR